MRIQRIVMHLACFLRLHYTFSVCNSDRIENCASEHYILSLTQEHAVDLHHALTLATTVGRKTCRSCQKHESLSLHGLLSTGRHLLRVSFITRLKSNLCIALATHNTTENNYISSNAQNTTAFQPKVF